MATSAELRERWSLDGNQLSNCLSIAMVACLVPRAPLSDGLYLAGSILTFVALGFANHLFPRRLHRLTHGVKAAYTHVLAASLAATNVQPWLWLAIVVSLVDLLPLVLRDPRLRVTTEAIGATVRWSLIVLGFERVGFPTWLVLVFGACSAVYHWERKRRITSGRRHDYGPLHAFEHVAIWLWLLVLDADRLSLPWVWRTSVGVLAVVVISLVIAGVWTNVRALRRLSRELPAWFDPRMRPLILRKCRDNALSRRWQHYVIKPFTPKISNRRVSWNDIEAMIDQIELRGHFDIAVGVLSGGAFFTRRLADRHGIATVGYAHSRRWSQLSLARNAMVSLRYYLGLPNPVPTRFLHSDLDLQGKRVLVVDDSVCTGATLASVTALCREHGAREVETLALFCDSEHPADHSACTSKTPLVWPWGWEAD